MHTPFLRKNWLGLTLLVLTWLIFFWRILFGGQAYFLDDLKILYYPIESIYSQAQAAWQLPIWSHYFGFGHPALAWGQLGFFIPLHLILRALFVPPVLLLNISTALYSAVGLLGMYTFLRSQRLSTHTAALGAITFAFCGFVIGHLNHVNFYTATMLLPWLLLAVSALISKPTFPRAAALAIVAAIIPLSGQPQIALYTFIIAAVFGAVTFVGRFLPLTKGEYPEPNVVQGVGVKIVLLTLLAATLAFCLASFSILPLREFLPSSDRAHDLPIEELYEFSYPVAHLTTLLNPYFFGDHVHYTGAKNFQELAAYVGFLPLALAFGGLVWPSKKYAGLRIVSCLLILIAIAFAPGKYSPIYRFLVDNHIWTSLAVPGRFVYFFDVGIALLAAVSLEAIFLPLTKGESRARRGVGVATAVAVVALASANLIWWGWNYNPLTPRTGALKISPFTETLRQYERDTGIPARLYASETLQLSGPVLKRTDPRADFYPETDTERDLLLRHIQATANTSAGRWVGALGIANFRTFVDNFFVNDREPFDGEDQHAIVRFRNLLNASSVTHIAHALPANFADQDPVLTNNFTLLQESRVGQNTLLRLYTNPQAFPKAYLVGTAIWESGSDQTRHALGHPQYDPANLVYISGPKPPEAGTLPNQEEPSPAALPLTELGSSRAEIISYTPTRVEIAVTSEKPAWLILTDSFTPQWQTFLDGAPAPQYVANSVFRAAQVPAGSHTIVFQYVSPAIQQAKWLTLGGLIAVAILLTAPQLKKFVIRI